MLSQLRQVALVAAAALLAGACGDDPNPVEPPTTGSLTITVETVGNLPDPNGYQVTRTGAAPLDLPVNGSVRLDSVAPGSYSFALGKASLYCAVENGATRDAQVVAGQSAQVTFRVRCERNGLAYVVNRNSGTTLNISFPGRDPVTLASGVNPARIMFSRDGRRIVYGTGAGAGPVGISAIDLDSLRVTEVTPAGSPNRMHPSWSPDGTRVAYATPTDIRTVRVGEAAETIVWQVPAGVRSTPVMPVWSPDGTRIAFVRSGDGFGDQQLVVVNADGTGERVLRDFVNIGYLHIDWSPDGTRIVMPELSLWTSVIYTVNVATGQALRVVEAGVRDYRGPIYLPDGRIGMYALTDRGALDGNWIVNADGTGLTQAALPASVGAAVAAWQ
jgi:Tol biopolymer transport system component